MPVPWVAVQADISRIHRLSLLHTVGPGCVGSVLVGVRYRVSASLDIFASQLLCVMY